MPQHQCKHGPRRANGLCPPKAGTKKDGTPFKNRAAYKPSQSSIRTQITSPCVNRKTGMLKVDRHGMPFVRVMVKSATTGKVTLACRAPSSVATVNGVITTKPRRAARGPCPPGHVRKPNGVSARTGKPTIGACYNPNPQPKLVKGSPEARARMAELRVLAGAARARKAQIPCEQRKAPNNKHGGVRMYVTATRMKKIGNQMVPESYCKLVSATGPIAKAMGGRATPIIRSTPMAGPSSAANVFSFGTPSPSPGRITDFTNWASAAGLAWKKTHPAKNYAGQNWVNMAGTKRHATARAWAVHPSKQ